MSRTKLSVQNRHWSSAGSPANRPASAGISRSFRLGYRRIRECHFARLCGLARSRRVLAASAQPTFEQGGCCHNLLAKVDRRRAILMPDRRGWRPQSQLHSRQQYGSLPGRGRRYPGQVRSGQFRPAENAWPKAIAITRDQKIRRFESRAALNLSQFDQEAGPWTGVFCKHWAVRFRLPGGGRVPLSLTVVNRWARQKSRPLRGTYL